MKSAGIFILLVLVGLNCNKPHSPSPTIVVDLTIISTQRLDLAIQGQDIYEAVKCAGTDLCYQFSHFEVKKRNEKEFDIRAKATYPNSDAGYVVCPLAIYYKDTTVGIPVSSKGLYILRFYNKAELFKADSVLVN